MAASGVVLIAVRVQHPPHTRLIFTLAHTSFAVTALAISSRLPFSSTSVLSRAWQRRR
ncbi:hypothetical protein EXIGLDRAFT_349735 [Exidia glandulosa HHB12029]|uniref:Uncharacterized protein n=1 Tax=Exidia glandulosa HHB12029 TaxID=1314781 RepID=A0A165CDZ7_EXIGL|nr:hypothetical protein EXIGLDRAFT_349735 [Exidia glandulosa HHB12029]